MTRNVLLAPARKAFGKLHHMTGMVTCKHVPAFAGKHSCVQFSHQYGKAGGQQMPAEMPSCLHCPKPSVKPTSNTGAQTVRL